MSVLHNLTAQIPQWYQCSPQDTSSAPLSWVCMVHYLNPEEATITTRISNLLLSWPATITQHHSSFSPRNQDRQCEDYDHQWGQQQVRTPTPRIGTSFHEGFGTYPLAIRYSWSISYLITSASLGYLHIHIAPPPSFPIRCLSQLRCPIGGILGAAIEFTTSGPQLNVDCVRETWEELYAISLPGAISIYQFSSRRRGFGTMSFFGASFRILG